MISRKRLDIATILGVGFGVVQWALSLITYTVPWSGIVEMILARTILGFAIGISAWAIRWWLHGILMGLIFSLPCAFGSLWVGFGWNGFIMALALGIVFGLLIELITTVAFKAKMPQAKK